MSYRVFIVPSVFNWTNSDVLDWLVSYVELPQYASTFKKNHITGRQLPYIAANYGQILQNTLLITDNQHKQKIQLRAMDVILFGPPIPQGHWKDTIVILSTFLSVCGILYALRQRRLSQSRIDSFMEDLRLKEEEVSKLKSKFQALETELTDGPMGNPEEENLKEDSHPVMSVGSTSGSSSSDEESSPAPSYCK